MTFRSHTGSVAVLLLFATASLHAQQVSFSAGGIHTRYADSLSGSAGSAGVRLGVSSPRFSTTLDGVVAAFTDGYWVTQAAGGAFGVAYTSGPFVLGVRADGSVNYLDGGIWSGIGAAGPAIAIAGRHWLGAVTLTGGGLRRIDGTRAALASLGVQGRHTIGTLAISADLGGTIADTIRYADASLGSEWTSGPATLAATAGIRLGDLGDTPWIQGRAALRIAPLVSLEGTIGTYPRDVTGFTDGFFVKAGVRITAARGMRRPSGRIDLRRRGDHVQVTFKVDGASHVAIAAEWNEWRPTPLARVGGDRWRIDVPLASGAYRFVLVTDDGAWVVPDGVPRMPDDFGGDVGLLIVP